MITSAQVVVHLLADFYVQTDWMGVTKKEPGLIGALACGIHTLTYTLPFLLLTQSWPALLFIAVTHYILDRTYIVAYLIWLKNQLAPRSTRAPWPACKASMGLHPSRPPFIAHWIAIVVDNTFHVILNGLAIHYLG